MSEFEMRCAMKRRFADDEGYFVMAGLSLVLTCLVVLAL